MKTPPRRTRRTRGKSPVTLQDLTSASSASSVVVLIHRMLISLLLSAFGVAASAAEQGQDVAVRAFVDRPAAFVGDRVTYTIEVTCKRGIDVLIDDLSRDRFALEGLDIVGSDVAQEAGPGETTVYRFRYYATTYRVDVPALKIAPPAVRYYVKRTGQRPDDAAPAGEVRVPGLSIPFRSLLPDDSDVAGLRDHRPATARPAAFVMLRSAGIGLVIVSILPVLFAVAGLIRRPRVSRPRRSTRSVRHEERASLDAVRAIDLATVEGRREAFNCLDTVVREHLRDACGVPGPNLTSSEIVPALAGRGERVPIELVSAVLTVCELARYAPPHDGPSADACRQTIEQAEQVISAA
jgi:hypothetical protein